MTSTVNLIVNGEPTAWEVADGERLLDSLRAAGHTEVKEGCGSGECGACTVLLEGEPICSCLTFTAQAAGTEVRTASAVAAEVPELVDALVDETAVQCGFCTPGVMVSAGHLLITNPTPTVEDIKGALEGNLCRCTGYHRIIAAVQAAAATRRSKGQPAIREQDSIKVQP